MAINANMNTSYELSNYEQLLAPVIAKAEAEMAKEKGGAAQLKAELHARIRACTFIGAQQFK